MPPDQAMILYEFLLKERPAACLELGFAHGVSSCYIAAALDEVGVGHLTSVDLASSRLREPTIEELLERTGLGDRVTVVREPTSYTWFLKKEIEHSTTGNVCTPVYDFCFVDGAKNWTIDGFAFFLVDKLLRQGGWVLFDDLNWNYASTGKAESDGISLREMSDEELRTPHIALVFELLVKQHPSYGELRVQDDHWAWAHKTDAGPRVLIVEETASLRTLAIRAVRRAARKARR